MFTSKRITDPTALERQNRRIAKLKAQGISRATVFVHQDCKAALDELRPHFINVERADSLAQLVLRLETKTGPTNVSKVNQLSPFRYPGGKTWLVPEIRSWLRTYTTTPNVFVEPFAGGAMAGLTAAAEDLAHSVALSELDEDVAAVWETIFDGTDAAVDALCNRIVSFKVTLENVREALAAEPKSVQQRAFRTIVKNRMQRGGIMASGAGLVKEGEAGRGLKSRWYPATLVKRIRALRLLRNRVTFQRRDAFDTIQQFRQHPSAFFFIDPPYTAGGKKAGSRLYTHSEVDHERLFAEMASVRGTAMLTYDDAPEVRKLANRHGFRIQTIPMKNTHHSIMRELLILKA